MASTPSPREKPHQRKRVLPRFEPRVRLARLTPRARPARPRRVCGCAAQRAAPLSPTRALRRHTLGALWDRLADGTVGCVACAWRTVLWVVSHVRGRPWVVSGGEKKDFTTKLPFLFWQRRPGAPPSRKRVWAIPQSLCCPAPGPRPHTRREYQRAAPAFQEGHRSPPVSAHGGVSGCAGVVGLRREGVDIQLEAQRAKLGNRGASAVGKRARLGYRRPARQTPGRSSPA